MKIVQMTSVHPWTDTRVFVKMSVTVAARGHEVHLVVPRTDAPEVEVHRGVTVHAVAPANGRYSRMTETVDRVLEVSKALQGDLYQFHDPEFLTRAVRFQDHVGVPVVFDSHEDYRLDLMSRHYLPHVVRPAVGFAIGLVEDFAVQRLAGVIAATPSIGERFQDHPHCLVVQNFPIADELAVTDVDRLARRRHHVGYVGTVCEDRGVKQMVEAIFAAGPKYVLELAGAWSPPGLRQKCELSRGWAQVLELGYLDRIAIREMFGRVNCGLILMQPIPSFLAAYPVKMFEYMAAGLPIIASDFPLWRSIVAAANCGVLVDPKDPAAIGAAIRLLAEDNEMAAKFGENGRKAIEDAYNWEVELEKLLAFYGLLSGRPYSRDSM